ncbi:MAG TPA: RsfA family transcriptional regulator [Bacillus bacterium]|nr:RsfA family transcriptional regulator [Bacillus sp. (in: firmicutes)]
MTTLRQDAWTQDEDLLLAEVVLRHIRDGSTQLAAFDEVGQRLSRTAAACGFRWNSAIRKQYKSAIEIAKKQRKGEKVVESPQLAPPIVDTTQEGHNVENNNDNDSEKKSVISFHAIIDFLSSLESTMKSTDRLMEENESLRNELASLKQERIELLQKIEKLTENYHLIEEDYKALIEIMERARKMIVLQEDEGSKFKFQMDKNGNLERVKK